ATERGSPTSHAAILARSLGVPAVVAAEGLVAALDEATGVDVLVDGDVGEVIVAPDRGRREQITRRLRERATILEQHAELVGEPGRTADGRRIELAANLGSLDDVEAAIRAGAEGSGLVRTEFLYLGRAEAPSLDEQVEVYTRLLAAFPGHRVVF